MWLTVSPKKLETGSRPNSAGIPFTLLLRIEAIEFPTFGLLLYVWHYYRQLAAVQATVALSSLWNGSPATLNAECDDVFVVTFPRFLPQTLNKGSRYSYPRHVLAGSLKVGLISRITIVIAHFRRHITTLTTTYEPPRNPKPKPEVLPIFNPGCGRPLCSLLSGTLGTWSVSRLWFMARAVGLGG